MAKDTVSLEENFVSLIDFLLENRGDLEATAKVVPGDRFVGRPFTIRAMTPQEFNQFRKLSNKTRIIKGKAEPEFLNDRFDELCIINCTVDPNFKDEATMKKAGVATSEQLLYAVLKAGEISALSAEISSVSGFDRSEAEYKEETKNE